PMFLECLATLLSKAPSSLALQKPAGLYRRDRRKSNDLLKSMNNRIGWISAFLKLSEFQRSSDCRKNLLCREAFGMRQQHLKYLLDHLALPPSSDLRQIRLRAGKGRRLLSQGRPFLPAKPATWWRAPPPWSTYRLHDPYMPDALAWPTMEHGVTNRGTSRPNRLPAAAGRHAPGQPLLPYQVQGPVVLTVSSSVVLPLEMRCINEL